MKPERIVIVNYHGDKEAPEVRNLLRASARWVEGQLVAGGITAGGKGIGDGGNG